MALKPLQDKLLSTPVLTLPHHPEKYTLDTDAYSVQAGCVLLQEQEYGTNRPMGYCSRRFNDAQRAYDTTHRKRSAVVRAAVLLRPYVEDT